MGVSPAPAEGRSLRSRRTTSSAGTSVKRGTRYCEKWGFRMRPFSKRTASKSAPPMPCTMAPSTWLRRPSGLTTAPHSNAATTRRMLHAGGIADRPRPRRTWRCSRPSRCRPRCRIRGRRRLATRPSRTSRQPPRTRPSSRGSVEVLQPELRADPCRARARARPCASRARSGSPSRRGRGRSPGAAASGRGETGSSVGDVVRGPDGRPGRSCSCGTPTR